MVAFLINSVFYEDCDRGRNPYKQGCNHFVGTTIIVIVLRNKSFFVRLNVTPRPGGRGDVTERTYAGQKYPHVCMLSISTR